MRKIIKRAVRLGENTLIAACITKVTYGHWHIIRALETAWYVSREDPCITAHTAGDTPN